MMWFAVRCIDSGIYAQLELQSVLHALLVAYCASGTLSEWMIVQGGSQLPVCLID